MSDTCINERVLSIIHGDITQQTVDAIVNAANSSLMGGGGVDGAIHRAGGPSIMAECRRIGRCAPGDAVVTGAGALPARYVFHAVAPIYAGGQRGEATLLQRAYQRSLGLAAERDLHSIAFPSLGTGAYGYPLQEAAEIALGAIIAHLHGKTSLERVVCVLFGGHSLRVYEDVLRSLVVWE